MNLLYVTKELPFGSAEAFIYTELAHHQARGHEITVVPVRKAELKHESGRALLPQTLAEPLISVRILYGAALEALCHPITILRALRETFDPAKPILTIKNMTVWMKGIWLARELRLRRVDHMHVHWIAVPATMGMIASRISGVPFSITAHRYDIAQGNLLPQKFMAARFVRAIDGQGVEELIAQIPAEQKPPILIRMGVDIPDIEPRFRDGALTQMRGLIGARFVAKKGHATLIDAIAAVRAMGIELQMDLFGDGPLQASLEKKVASLGLEEAIHFRGVASHDRLKVYLSSGEYDFAALPSVTAADGDKEGVPVFLMEAMAAGLPVVATPNGGISELILPGTGILVPEHDSAALADAICRIAASEEDRRKMGYAARQQVREAFSINGCMDQLEKLMSGDVAKSLARR